MQLGAIRQRPPHPTIAAFPCSAPSNWIPNPITAASTWILRPAPSSSLQQQAAVQQGTGQPQHQARRRGGPIASYSFHSAPCSIACGSHWTGKSAAFSAWQQRLSRHQLRPLPSPAATHSAAEAGTLSYESNAASLVSTLRDWRRVTGSSGGGGYVGDQNNTAGAVAGGVVAALTLAYQEAKQGPWMARGFVARFVECGGAEEVLPLMHDAHPHVAGAAFELVQVLVGQHLAAREALLVAGAVPQLLQLLDGPTAARRAKFDTVMLLSDLLETALAADAVLASRAAEAQCESRLQASTADGHRDGEAGLSVSGQSSGSQAGSAAVLAGRMAERGGLQLVVRRLRSSDPAARAMAARLVGLVASCGDVLRAELLAVGVLPSLIAALEATEALTAAVTTSGGGGRIAPSTVGHDTNMQHQIACGLLQLCAVSSSQAAAAGAAVSDNPERLAPENSEERVLVHQLVDMGAVPPLLRLHSLSYPRPLREGARRVLRPMLRHRGEAVRMAAAAASIPQPKDTPPADWLAWRVEFERDHA